jgi:hypothetical protein
MGHLVYPDAPTADALGEPRATPLHLKVDTAMRVFVPVKMLVANDADEMFIRIAMSGATPARHPRIELALQDPGSAGQGSNIDPNVNTSGGTRVQLSDETGLVAAAANFVPRFVQGVPVYHDNVYLLKVVLFPPIAQLRIRITNKTEADRDFVWVVADNEDESRQPWIHATPPGISFDMLTGETREQEIQISNRGTGHLVVRGLDPGFPSSGADGSQVGPLPMTLAPNTSAKLSLEFSAADEARDFETIPQQLISDDPGPFGAQAHNRDFNIGLRIRFPEPHFQPAPKQFTPKRGSPANDEIDLPGREITLFGTNFNAGNLSIRFGEVEATSIVSRSATEIHVNVPAMEGPRAVQITVETGGGITKTDEEFRVSPLPIIDELNGMQFADMVDPSETTFRILGLNFIAEVGDTVRVHCVFDGKQQPNKLFEVIELDVLSLKSTEIRVQWPVVENFHQLIGVPATMKVTRSDEGFGQLEFEIKGL